MFDALRADMLKCISPPHTEGEFSMSDTRFIKTVSFGGYDREDVDARLEAGASGEASQIIKIGLDGAVEIIRP